MYGTVEENEITDFIHVQICRRARFGDYIDTFGSCSIPPKSIHNRKGNFGAFAFSNATVSMATIIGEHDAGNGVAGCGRESIQAIGYWYDDINHHIHVAATTGYRCRDHMVKWNR